jgi:hypothetical protein
MAKTSTVRVVVLSSLFAAGCGGDGSDAPVTAELGTLAYVVTECRDTPEGFVEHQSLRIRQGDGSQVTVMETAPVGPLAVAGLCRLRMESGGGIGFPSSQAFQRLGVIPDGSSVVFELNDEFSSLPLELPPEQEGIFIVRSDGTGLRRLRPASREPAFFPLGGGTIVLPGLQFAPDGQATVLTDRGPGPDGTEARQIFTVDLATAERRQITHLPAAVPPPHLPPSLPSVCCPRFIDDTTVGFLTLANPADLNPQNDIVQAIVQRDGSGLELSPVPVALPGAQVVPAFTIVGNEPTAVSMPVPGEPVNPGPLSIPWASEVFMIDGDNVLQLTAFRRTDTMGALLTNDRQRVFFIASTNILGSNASENCQVFSIDTTGADLRQVTAFQEAERSIAGCTYARVPGCAVEVIGQDSNTDALLLQSNCDPLGTNPFGGQVFAMRPDGSGIRQLTETSGLVLNPDGTVFGQLPGPVAYGPQG